MSDEILHYYAPPLRFGVDFWWLRCAGSHDRLLKRCGYPLDYCTGARLDCFLAAGHPGDHRFVIPYSRE